jgi:hypothetical protein
VGARQPIVIPQGDSVNILLSVPEVEAGDTATAQMRAWAGGPLLATFAVGVNAADKQVRLRLSSSMSTQIKRSGVYDVQLLGTSGIRTVKYGPAILRAQTTTLNVVPYLSYGEYSSLDYGDYAVLSYGDY